MEGISSHMEPGSKLIHDGDRSHSIIVEKLGLTYTVDKADELKDLEDKDNPLDPINEINSVD